MAYLKHIFIFLILSISTLVHAQSGGNCNEYKKLMDEYNPQIINNIKPEKRLRYLRLWMTNYNLWEICSEWELDFELDDQAAIYKKELAEIEKDVCAYCENSLEANLSKFSIEEVTSSLAACNCDEKHPILIKMEYENAINGSIDDCTSFLEKYPDSKYAQAVIDEQTIKKEKLAYQVAINGNINDWNGYLNQYPNGLYIAEIKTKKERYYKVKSNGNSSLWDTGDRICNATQPEGTIQAVVENWNDSKTKLKVKILAGYIGMYQGEDIFKGNLIWISTDDWYECLGDEILNYDIPSASGGGLADRNNYKYSVGSKVSCRNWGNGNSGYDGIVIDKKDGKYLIKVTRVNVSGLFSTNLSPSACSGHVRLHQIKDIYTDEGVGSIIWVDRDCVE